MVDLHVGHQHPHFWSIVTRFMDYYSPFWGPVVFSIVVEPQGALTCQSSTLAVLADYGAFVAYYSLFWGPGVISTIDEPQGALKCR